MRDEEFYAIVIDDKPDVCRTIVAKLDGPRGEGDEDLRASVTAASAVIEVVRQNDTADPQQESWTFSNRVVEELHRAAQRMPDLVIIDYFFVDPEMGRRLKDEARSGSLSREKLLRSVLSPLDLRRWIENVSDDDPRKRDILQHLFGATCPVYLHSYTPEGMTLLAGPIDERRRSLARVFPAAVVHAIDTRRLLYNDDVFDWPNPKPRYDPEYYPYQLAVYFDQIVDKELIRARLERSRYLKLQRTTTTVAGIAAIGGGIGLASAWVGDYVAEAITSRDMMRGLSIALLLLLALLALGTMLPFLFERLMDRLLRDATPTSREKDRVR